MKERTRKRETIKNSPQQYKDNNVNRSIIVLKLLWKLTNTQ